ncbi:MAG: hypothetical protein M3460_28635 [Actinomycetota bacterium]|nr:hypothetical protein [Actinomycetota bacterium]
MATERTASQSPMPTDPVAAIVEVYELPTAAGSCNDVSSRVPLGLCLDWRRLGGRLTGVAQQRHRR